MIKAFSTDCLSEASVWYLNACAILAEGGAMAGAVKCLLNGIPLDQAALQNSHGSSGFG